MNVEIRLNLHFVFLAIVGGILLSSGVGDPNLAVVATVASLFAFLLVDLLGVLTVASWIAYLLMALVTFVCVGGFLSDDGGDQLRSVAQLLVFVQAILHFQTKNQRVYEQLGIFALLEVIVAAVVNDALMFGVLFIPLGLVGLSTMLLYQVFKHQTAASGVEDMLSSTKAAVMRKRDTGVGQGIVVLAPPIILIASTCPLK